MATPDRHRLLAGATRARLLELLTRANASIGVRELAQALGLHPNSVREQLDRLVEADLVRVEPARAAGRGRPSLRYAATRRSVGDGDGYRQLAAALADQLSRLPDADAGAAAAGERWGRALVAGVEPTVSEDAAITRLIGLLDEAGFAPELPAEEATPSALRLRACPFVELARDRRDVVCGVHLGMMRGALRGLGARSDIRALEPFAGPDLCLAHLGGSTDA